MKLLLEFLTKIGGGDVVKLLEKDALPEGQSIEQLATDFLTEKIDIFKKSEEYKTALKESGKDELIVATKKFKKNLSKELELGLSGEEAATKADAELIDLVKKKHAEDLGKRTTQDLKAITDERDAAIKKANDLVNDYDSKIKASEDKYKALESQYETDKKTAKVNQVKSSELSKRTYVDPDDTLDLIDARLMKQGIKIDESGNITDSKDQFILDKDNKKIGTFSQWLDVNFSHKVQATTPIKKTEQKLTETEVKQEEVVDKGMDEFYKMNPGFAQ
jgi:hypothetical protein